MNFPRLSGTLHKLAKAIRKNSPTILLVSGLVSGCASLYFTARATVKAVREVDSHEEKLSGIEIVKMTWKHYIPAVVTAGGSAACFIGMHSIHQKRIAALLTAYKASEATLLQYHDKIVETIGEKKEMEAKEEMVKEHILENPPTIKNIIVIDPDGEIIYDEPNKRYYQIKTDKIWKAFKEIDKELLTDKVYLNRYYELIDLPKMDIGDIYVWTTSADGVEVRLVGCDRAYTDINRPAFEPVFWPPYGLDKEMFE